MGCEVKVHEKADKHGTWAYNSVDGWYLATSPEHYRTHLCHIKTTNSERFTDTTQFIHKMITKPTITHADKIMATIDDFTKAIKNTGSNDGKYEMQQRLQLTEKSVRHNEAMAKSANPAPPTNAKHQDGITHAPPRGRTMQTLEDNDIRMTRKNDQGIPTTYEGAPNRSSEGGETVNDGAGQPPTQQSNDNKKQGT